MRHQGGGLLIALRISIKCLVYDLLGKRRMDSTYLMALLGWCIGFFGDCASTIIFGDFLEFDVVRFPFQIGQGTYSNVYKARDTLTGKIVALKKVRFDNLEPESVKFMAREILILQRLDHPNVLKLEGLVTSRMSCSLYLVFQYMEHDLAGLASSPGIKFTEPQVSFKIFQSPIFLVRTFILTSKVDLLFEMADKVLYAPTFVWA